ncbi:replicative DNA helicase [Streptomyces sp. sk226]|uniref:replicative DNA helicase n=1 Tax=Streptomyces sp. sk226 TaxID=2034268 RepID=UPI000BF0BD39|nr:replicative DNA helicase [Streptomyces sp. sk226]
MSIPPQTTDRAPAYQDHDEPPYDIEHETHQAARGFERVPPWDLDAEQGSLGGMLLSKDAISAVVGKLGKPRDGIFYRPAHETVYRAIFDLWAAGEPVDPITTAAELVKRGEITKVGGASYLHALVQAVPTAANADYYAEIVLERSKRRRAIETHTKAVQDLYAEDGDTDELIDRSLATLQDLTVATMEAPKLSVADRWQDYLDQLEQGEDPSAIESPYKDLNDVVSIKAGDLVTIGAETGGGKSLVAIQWGAHVAMRQDKPVLFFSMEMSATSLMSRITACTAKVDLGRLDRKKDITESDWDKIRAVSDQMSRAHNFILEDDGSVTLSTIRARARWMASKGMPVGLIMVDYVQLMEAETKANRGNRTQEVADISRGLKRIAMDFNVPVISLAQFNREAKDRKPQVTDFKESSAIEQDSSVILLMHSPRDSEGEIITPDEITMTVAKNRNGVKGREIELIKRAHYARLDNKRHQ